MTAVRVIACFSALLSAFFAIITLWLATNGQSAERPLVWYAVASGVGWLLTVVFIRAAVIGKLPRWFESFLDAQ